MSKDPKPWTCEVCGEIILDDDQEYCDYCGSKIDRGGSGKASGEVKPTGQPVREEKPGDTTKRLWIWVALVLFILLIYYLKH